MKKALVTGSNGFIGHHLVKELLARGYSVNCLVRYTSDLALLRGLPVSLYIGDVREPETLAEPLKDAEYVFHLGAKLLVPTRQDFEETNTQGTINMLEAAAKHSAGTLKRFLYVSSQAAVGPNKDATPYNETLEPQPISWYGTSKKKAEDAVRAHAGRLPVTIVRPSSVYGEEEKDISQAFPAVQMGLRPKLGLNTKHVVMVYVGDLVKGMVDAAESANTLNQTYFLNRADVMSAVEVVNVAAKIVGKPDGPVIPVPMFLIRALAPLGELIYYVTRQRPPITRDKALELSQLYWLADPSKAQRDFGWVAGHSVEEGLTNTIRYWQQKRAQEHQQVINEPFRERAAVTFGLAIVVGLIEALIDLPLGGIILTGLAHALGLAAAPWWLTLLSLVVVFGVLMGAVALLTARRPLIWQFVGGAAIGAGLELINQLWLHWWSWNPITFGRIPGPLLPALLLGVPAGLYPILINTAVNYLYSRRLKYS